MHRILALWRRPIAPGRHANAPTKRAKDPAICTTPPSMCEKALSTYAKAPSMFPKAPLQELQGYVGIFQEITDFSMFFIFYWTSLFSTTRARERKPRGQLWRPSCFDDENNEHSGGLSAIQTTSDGAIHETAPSYSKLNTEIMCFGRRRAVSAHALSVARQLHAGARFKYSLPLF